MMTDNLFATIQPKWFVLAIAAMMALLLVQQLRELNEVRRPAQPGQGSAGQQAVTQSVNAPALMTFVDKNLFGNPRAEEKKPKVDTTAQIPKTKLKLSLIGAIVETTGKSSALIQNSKKKVKRYYEGDKLEGGAVLYSVAADSVVIKRGEKLETLAYPVGAGVDVETDQTTREKNMPAAKNKQPASNKKLKSLRDRLKAASGK